MTRSNPEDPEILRLVAEAARIGMKYELMAQYAGIAPSSLYKWLRLGRAGSDRHSAFAKAIDQNAAKGAARLLARITQSADAGHWQAAAWILERRHGYRRDSRVEVHEARPHDSRAPDNMDEMLEALPSLPLSLRLKIAAALGLNDATNESETAG